MWGSRFSQTCVYSMAFLGTCWGAVATLSGADPVSSSPRGTIRQISHESGPAHPGGCPTDHCQAGWFSSWFGNHDSCTDAAKRRFKTSESEAQCNNRKNMKAVDAQQRYLYNQALLHRREVKAQAEYVRQVTCDDSLPPFNSPFYGLYPTCWRPFPGGQPVCCPPGGLADEAAAGPMVPGPAKIKPPVPQEEVPAPPQRVSPPPPAPASDVPAGKPIPE